ncbi:preprotein translocase subunit YajC [Chlamydia buteonis]|uniref:Sec translocon accessory complex subunit YajC n=1 Tax=Chlamydia buteonis TaxID=2494525 RepID=A0ABX8LA71_9CHLA|nr:preprotein translocase subunit YajC [Chlamydia buteonis]QXE26773.1 preprotein translocase subunit YajC [Chlamydia buteonis]QXE28275.1 preprotein translocase subunit YajC [Chlamydia buteonis]
MFSRLFTCFLFLLSSSSLLADEDGSQVKSTFAQPAVMLGIAILFFYFILWRPEQKRRKSMEKRKNELAKGDKVTAMGILGTIDEIREHTVILSVTSGKIEILKAAISEILKPDGTKA